MQPTLDLFSASTLADARTRLRRMFPNQRGDAWLDPVSQLIKSIISSRTYDHVSSAAFGRLCRHYICWSELATADILELESLIADCTHADAKARHLIGAVRAIQAEKGVLSLDFLVLLPEDAGLAWLERIHGIGRKIAAAVLNFSDLRKRALVIDTHVLRVAQRLGWVSHKARNAEQAYEALVALIPSEWDADDLSELHWLLKRLGQSFCRHAETECGMCPARALCPRIGLAQHSADGGALTEGSSSARGRVH